MPWKCIKRKRRRFAPKGTKTFGLKILEEKYIDLEKRRRRTYWRTKLPDSVHVVAITTKGDVITISEYQPGVGAAYPHFIGETLNRGEKPLDGARRGLREEAGYKAKSAILLSSILADSSRSTKIRHMVLMAGCSKIAKKEDDIEVVLMKPKVAWKMILDYLLTDPEKKHGAGAPSKHSPLPCTTSS